MGYINFICTSKIDNQEIILIAYGYGSLSNGDFEIVDSKTFELLTDENISSKLYNGIIHKIIEISNGEFLISTYENIQKIILKKDNNTNKLKVTKVSDFLLHQYENRIIQIVKLENDNIVILKQRYYLRLHKLTELDNEKKDTYLTTMNLPNPTLEHYDMISINNDIIVFINIKYLNIFSLENKQIITRFELIISGNTDDIVRKISDDMIFFCGFNNLYFISIKKGIIVKHITIPHIYRIIALGDLSDNNILCAALNFENYRYRLVFCQVKYIFEKKDEKKEKELKVNINSVFKLKDPANGNVYIKELENKRIIFGTQETIYIFE